jgi:hypothetical protein
MGPGEHGTKRSYYIQCGDFLLREELLASQWLCCIDVDTEDADEMQTGGWIAQGIKKLQDKEQEEHQGDHT